MLPTCPSGKVQKVVTPHEPSFATVLAAVAATCADRGALTLPYNILTAAAVKVTVTEPERRANGGGVRRGCATSTPSRVSRRLEPDAPDLGTIPSDGLWPNLNDHSPIVIKTMLYSIFLQIRIEQVPVKLDAPCF